MGRYDEGMWKCGEIYGEMLRHNEEIGGEMEGYGERLRHNGETQSYHGESYGEIWNLYGETWNYHVETYGETERYYGETGGEIGCHPCWTGKGSPPLKF